MNDSECLRQYVANQSEDAFEELVRNRIDLVYATALRCMGGDHHRAADVTQSVFCDLARKARTLVNHPCLVGWLHSSAHFAATKVRRTEARRHAREQAAADMERLGTTSNAPNLEGVRQELDQAMLELSERNRRILLLRYFDSQLLAEIGRRLGMSENAAQKSLERALSKLRGCLERRGITSTEAAIGAFLAEQSAIAAPTGLSSTVLVTALAATSSTVPPGLGLGVLLQFMSTSKTVLSVATVVTLLSLGSAYHDMKLRRTAEVALASERQDFERAKQQWQSRMHKTELLTRQEPASGTASATVAPDSMTVQMANLLDHISALKDWLGRHPEQRIGEFAYLKEENWLDMARHIKSLDTEADFDEAAHGLRVEAEMAFMGEGGPLQNALKAYLSASNDVLPSDISQLAAYLDPSVDPSLLQHYAMVARGPVAYFPGAPVYATNPQTAVIDPAYDRSVVAAGPGNVWVRGGSPDSDMRYVFDVFQAQNAYVAAHGGLQPQTQSEVLPYFANPQDGTRFLTSLQKRP